MKLTDRTIKALKPKPARYEVWADGNAGFGMRVSPAGRKSWIYLYRFEGKSRRMTLGTYPAVGLASAHVKHAQAKELLEKGDDPGSLHVEKRRAERQAETVQTLADEYLEKWARPRKRSAGEDERILNKDVIPTWGKRKARSITRRDVILLLDGIVDRGSPIQANRTLAVVRKMFNFAISRDIVGATPVAMVKAPARENQRDRVLSAEEIRIFWNGLDQAPMSAAVKLLLKLQLATAQRKGELVGAALSEFDFDEGVWTISAARVKNRIAHRVPLSPLTLELIEEARDVAKQAEIARVEKLPGVEPREPEWLFPSPHGNGPIKPKTVNNALQIAMEPIKKGKAPAINLRNVTPHDLRRTAASNMAALGINRLVISKILNHVESSVTSIYDRHGYDAEKRHALESWAAHLQGILSGKSKPDNVVQLAAAGEAQ
jgi:integrase